MRGFSRKKTSKYYTLMRKDIEVLNFNITADKKLNYEYEQLKFLDRNKLPLGFLNIEMWINERIIPENRENRKLILSSDNFLVGDKINLFTLIPSSNLISISDDFWVKEKYDDKTKWNDISPFSNQSIGTIQATSLLGVEPNIDDYRIQPDLTTNGRHAKTWWSFGNGSISKLQKKYKGNLGHNTINEYLSSFILDKMEIDNVKYSIVKGMDDRNLIECARFTSENISFVPARQLFRDCYFGTIMQTVDSNLRNQIIDMLLFDTIVLNQKRTSDDWGFLVDNNTNEIISLAPLFDHEDILLPELTTGHLKNEEYMKEYLDVLDIGYIGQKGDHIGKVAPFITDIHERKLKRLLDFKFPEEVYEYEKSDYIPLYENLIQQRTQKLLSYRYK